MNYCIIGSGISGLTTAYKLLSLNKNSKVTLYEKNKLGGHSYTYKLNKDENIDLGFQVFNKNAYPNMINLFDELNIPIQKTNMSFSVSNSFIEWSSNLKSILRNILNIKFWSMIYNMLFFNSISNKYIKIYTQEKLKLTLTDFLENNNFSNSFKSGFIIPFCSSVWSGSPGTVGNFPLITLLKFMNNHGLLKINSDQWYTLKNRSQEYINKIMNRFGDRLTFINKSPNTIEGNIVDNKKYNDVIIAIHGNEVLNLVNDKKYKSIFEKIKYSDSISYLHQDISLMPKKRSDWTSWNFIGDSEFICTYWCNRLQTDLKTKNLFFSLNPAQRPNNIIHEVSFSHPQFNYDLIKAQTEINNIQGYNNIWFVGAYLGNGFHEDGVVSALKVVKQIMNNNLMIFYPLRDSNTLLHKFSYSSTLKIFKKIITSGNLNIQLPNIGLIKIKNQKSKNVEATIIIKSYKFFFSLLFKGELGFDEAYLKEYIETDNITNLLNLLALNMKSGNINTFNLSFIFNLFDKFKFFFKQDNSIENSKRNIADHYDLGNELYTRFLDNTMTYSSAIFNDLEIKFDNLSKAQLNKYDRIIDNLKINKYDNVLEIGCGWGGFAIRANQRTGCKITCLTLSYEQKKYFEKKIGNNKNIEILILDYRKEKRKFDKIVSIEMIEAVGLNYMDVYFESIRNNLKPGGSVMIQAICIPSDRLKSYSKNIDFIQKYVFPGGFIPSLDLIKTKVKNNNMKVIDVMDITIDYANTLKIWHEQFKKNWPDIKANWAQSDDHFYKIWKYYFAYCEVGFRNNLINAYQIMFNNI